MVRRRTYHGGFIMKALFALPLLALIPSLPGPPQEQDPPEEVRTIDGVLDTLYRSVSFGPGEEGDWKLLRSLLIEDAVFVQPPRGDVPRIWDTDEFVQDFKDFIASSPAKERGFHERIVARRTDTFGTIAHSYVVFESRFEEEGEPVGRGLDSIQLVKHEGRWWVVSITTAFETPNQPLPKRFLE